MRNTTGCFTNRALRLMPELSRFGATCAALLCSSLLLAGCHSMSNIPPMAQTRAQSDGKLSVQKGSLAHGRSRTERQRAMAGIAKGGAKQNIASLTEIIRRNPEDVNALNMRGAAFAGNRQHKRAFTDFSAALELDPQYYQAYANRAQVNLKLKRFNEAMNDFQRALQIKPDYEVALIGRGQIRQKNRMYAQALADFRQVIKQDPSHGMAYFQRGLTYQLMGRHDNAVSDLDIAVSLNPTSPQAYFSRGQSRFALQQYELAYDDFYVSARRGKKNVRAWTYRGLSAEKFGDPRKAKRAYQRALQVKPGFKPALDGLRRVAASAA